MTSVRPIVCVVLSVVCSLSVCRRSAAAGPTATANAPVSVRASVDRKEITIGDPESEGLGSAKPSEDVAGAHGGSGTVVVTTAPATPPPTEAATAPASESTPPPAEPAEASSPAAPPVVEVELPPVLTEGL